MDAVHAVLPLEIQEGIQGVHVSTPSAQLAGDQCHGHQTY
jgi:hypothetical protein